MTTSSPDLDAALPSIRAGGPRGDPSAASDGLGMGQPGAGKQRHRKRKSFGRRNASYDPRVGSLVRNERRVPLSVRVPDGGGDGGNTNGGNGNANAGDRAAQKASSGSAVADGTPKDAPQRNGDTGLSSLSPATAKKYKRSTSARNAPIEAAAGVARGEGGGGGRGQQTERTETSERGKGGGASGESDAGRNDASASAGSASAGGARAPIDMEAMCSDDERRASSAPLAEKGDSRKDRGSAGQANGRERGSGIGTNGHRNAKGAGEDADAGRGGRNGRFEGCSDEDTPRSLLDEGELECGGGGGREAGPDEEAEGHVSDGRGRKARASKRPAVPSREGRDGPKRANADGKDTAPDRDAVSRGHRGKKTSGGATRAAGGFAIYQDDEDDDGGGNEILPGSGASYGGNDAATLKRQGEEGSRDAGARDAGARRRGRSKDDADSAARRKEDAAVARRGSSKGTAGDERGGRAEGIGRRRRKVPRSGGESARKTLAYRTARNAASKRGKRRREDGEGEGAGDGQGEGGACEFRGLSNADTIREYEARRRRREGASTAPKSKADGTGGVRSTTYEIEECEVEERSSVSTRPSVEGSEESAASRSRSRSMSRSSRQPSFDLSAMEVEERPKKPPAGTRPSLLPSFEGVFARAKSESKATPSRGQTLSRNDLVALAKRRNGTAVQYTAAYHTGKSIADKNPHAGEGSLIQEGALVVRQECANAKGTVWSTKFGFLRWKLPGARPRGASSMYASARPLLADEPNDGGEGLRPRLILDTALTSRDAERVRTFVAKANAGEAPSDFFSESELLPERELVPENGSSAMNADIDGFTFVDTLGSAEKKEPKERKVLGDRSNTADRDEHGGVKPSKVGALGLRSSKSSRKRRKLSHPSSATSTERSVESGTATATNAVQFFVPAVDTDENGAYQDRKHFGLIEGMGGGVEETEKGSTLPHRGRIMELPGSVMPGKWEASVLDDDATSAVDAGSLSSLRISLRHNNAPSSPLEDFYAGRKPHPNGNTVSLVDPGINRVLSFIKQGVFRDEEEEHCDEEEEKVLNDSYFIGCVSIATFGGFTSSSVGVIEGREATEQMLAGCRPPSSRGIGTRRDKLLKMYGDERDVTGVLIPCKLGFDAEYTFLLSHDDRFRVTAIDVLFRKPRARRRSPTQPVGLTKSLLSEHQRHAGSSTGLAMERWLQRNAPRYTGGDASRTVLDSAGVGTGKEAACAPATLANASNESVSSEGKAVPRDGTPSKTACAVAEEAKLHGETATKANAKKPAALEEVADEPAEAGNWPVTLKDAGKETRSATGDEVPDDVSFAASGGDPFGDDVLLDQDSTLHEARGEALETSKLVEEKTLVDAYGDFEKSRKSTQLVLTRAADASKARNISAKEGQRRTGNFDRSSRKSSGHQIRRRSIAVDDDGIEPLIKSHRASDARRRRSSAAGISGLGKGTARPLVKRDTAKRANRLSVSRSTASPSEVIATRRSAAGTKAPKNASQIANLHGRMILLEPESSTAKVEKKRKRDSLRSVPSRKRPKKVAVVDLFGDTDSLFGCETKRTSVVKREPTKKTAKESKRASLCGADSSVWITSHGRRKSGANDKSSKPSTRGKATEAHTNRSTLQRAQPSRTSLLRRDASLVTAAVGPLSMTQGTKAPPNKPGQSKVTAKQSRGRKSDDVEPPAAKNHETADLDDENAFINASGSNGFDPSVGAELNGKVDDAEKNGDKGTAAAVPNDEGSVLSAGGASVSFESDIGGDDETEATTQPFYDVLFGQGILPGFGLDSDEEAESVCHPFYSAYYGLDDNDSSFAAQAEHELISLVPIPQTLSFHDCYFGKEEVATEEEEESGGEAECMFYPIHGVYFGLHDSDALAQLDLDLCSLVPPPLAGSFHDIYYGKEEVAMEEEEENDSIERSKAPARIPRCTVQSNPLLVATLFAGMLARRVHAYFSSS